MAEHRYDYIEYLEDDNLYEGWLERALNHESMTYLASRGLKLYELTFNEYGDIEDKLGDLIINLKTISFEEYLREKGIIEN